jgi:hypothetical protein
VGRGEGMNKERGCVGDREREDRVMEGEGVWGEERPPLVPNILLQHCIISSCAITYLRGGSLRSGEV